MLYWYFTACELVDNVSLAILTTYHPHATIFATVFNTNSIPLLSLAPEDILHKRFNYVFQLDGSLEARFNAIEALLQHFHWKRINILGFSRLGSHVSSFGTFAYRREWQVGSSVLVSNNSVASLYTTLSSIKQTGNI